MDLTTFSPNTKALSSEVNSNFELLKDAIYDLVNGWYSFEQTLTYESPTTMSGTGFLAQNSVGDKIKLNQSIPLTAYFPLEDKDSDVGTFTVANVGTPTYAAGKFSNALTLNGTDQALAITDAALLKPTGAFTIGAWIKTSTNGKFIFQSYSQNTAVAGLNIILSSNAVQLNTGKNTGTTLGTDYTSLTGSTNVCDGNYHYVVVTFQSGFAKIFIDGVLNVSGAMITPAYAATNYVRVGCRNITGTDDTWFNGQIDDLFFINGFAVDADWVAAKYAEDTAQGTGNITATQYFYVTARTDTLLTVAGGADYALYNGAITSPYYSKASSSVGFPGEFNIGNDYKFSIDRDKLTLRGWGFITGVGTSGAGENKTLPMSFADTNYDVFVNCLGYKTTDPTSRSDSTAAASNTLITARINSSSQVAVWAQRTDDQVFTDRRLFSILAIGKI